MENETDSRRSDDTLDLLNSEDQPVPNEFHLSNVKLEDLQGDIIDYNREEPSSLTGSTGEESVVECKLDESEDLPEAFYSKVAADENDSAEEEFDDNFREYTQQKISISNREKNKSVLEANEEDEAAEEEEIPRPFGEAKNRATKFTIESDIEEVDEEMEEDEISITEDFQQSGNVKMALPSTTKVISIETLLIQAKSKLALRAASMFEQRLKTISELKDLREERKKLRLKNRFLNEKCFEHLKKITTVNHFESTDGVLPIYKDQRYYNVLEEFMAMKIHYDKVKPVFEQETLNLTDAFYICRTRFEQVFDAFISRELEIGSECVDVNSGKVSNQKKIISFVKKQERKFEQLAEVRVAYLKLHNCLDSIHKSLRALNRMGETHTLMEYEQLVITNNSSMDKLDEREEELRKLRDQCTQDCTILSHLRETSDALIHEIIDAAAELKQVTRKKDEARNLLAVQCLKRDFLRKNHLRIHSATGLLTSPRLLRKMEEDSQALDELRQKVKICRQGIASIRGGNAVARSEANEKTSHTDEHQHISL